MSRQSGGLSKSKSKRKVAHSDWLIDGLQPLRPPQKMTVTQWVDQNIILDHSAAIPGPYKSWRTPYVQGIMDAFADPEIEEMWFCKPTQVGGSQLMLNIIGYIIAQDPSPTLIVYPTEEFAKSFSKTRIQPMIQLCPALRVKYLPLESTDTELHFIDMILYLGWSNSATSLAGRPIRFLFFDETSKYPSRVGKEPSPFELAIERTNTFPHNRKIVGASTPLLKTCKVWDMRDKANEVQEFHTPCPHCGYYQPFRFKPKLKWPAGSNADDARDLAYYECESCNGRITDSEKTVAERAGEWRATSKRGSGRRVTWFGLNAIYSPWIRFGDVAYKFLKSKDDPDELQNFVNSWLGEAWEDAAVRMSADTILERQSEYEETVVPDDALILTGGVDVQQDCLYWTVRAWAPGLTSWNIAHGQVLDWQDIEQVMNRTWTKRSGEELLVALCAVDSGNDTDIVYDFCFDNQEWAIPIKGASNPMLMRFKISTIDRVNSRAHGTRLVIVDGNQYKSMIASRMNRENGRGSWMVHSECDRAYAEQITSEERVPVKSGSQTLQLWRPKTTHPNNHYLDAEVYAACAADLMQVRYLDDATPEDAKEKQEAALQPSMPKGWTEPKKSWV